jgi:hypothetical protein
LTGTRPAKADLPPDGAAKPRHTTISPAAAEVRRKEKSPIRARWLSALWYLKYGGLPVVRMVEPPKMVETLYQIDASAQGLSIPAVF